MVKANDIQLLSVLFNKCVWAKKDYLVPSQVKLLEWYNNASRRNICIRTLNYMLRRLEDGSYIKRTQRQWPDARYNFWFRTTMYQWEFKGKLILERFGVKCIEILQEIKELMNGKNGEALPAATRKASGKNDWYPNERIKSLIGKIKTI